MIDSSGWFTAGSVALKASVVGSVTIAGRLFSDSGMIVVAASAPPRPPSRHGRVAGWGGGPVHRYRTDVG